MICLDDADLQKLLHGSLEPQEISRIDAHLDCCDDCRNLVADLMLAQSRVRRTVTDATSSSFEEPSMRARSPATRPQVGRRYVLLDLIGQGGMGSVYRAVDRLTQQMVALKRVLLGPRGAGKTASSHLGALAQEFRTLSTLRHPNIISVLDYGFDDERRPYFTMELLEGAEPLLGLAMSMPQSSRIELLLQILRALGYLHRRGILHRDLKPSNILVLRGAEGLTTKLLDFGLASSSDEAQRKQIAGTLPYIAPELLCGEAASEASDLYAIGVLAYEILCGSHPFRGEGGAAELMDRVVRKEPDFTPLPIALRDVVRRALCKSPSGRPASAEALAQEFGAAAGIAREIEPIHARDSYIVAARFTGREDELDRLRRALDGACRGHGSAWLVGGESGVGKSRLLDELRGHVLVEGVLAVRGQALPNGGTAYHVWRGVLEVLALHVELSPLEASVLGMVLPNLSALLERDVAPLPEVDVQVTRSRLLRVLREVVARSQEPVLVLLEDLQWADPESLLLLAQVSASLEGVPLLIVASYRDDEAPRLPSELGSMQVLRLQRFDRRGVERLCASMLGRAGVSERLVDLVARETEGNAYFIVEVVRALAEESGRLGDVGRNDLPEQVLAGGVEQVFERRLSRVPIEARWMLDLAAVAGRQLDLDVLGRGFANIEALVQACAYAGVLEVHEQRWRFGHDKLRERMLRKLDGDRLRDLHARVAESLEATYPESATHAAEIAYHYRAADRPAPAAHHYALAGEAALGRGSPREAETMLEHARALHERVRVSRLAEVQVWRGLAQARFGLGRLAETDEALRRVCALSGMPLPTNTFRLVFGVGRQFAEQVARRVGVARYLGFDPRSEEERTLREELLLGLSVQEVFVWLAEPEYLILCTLWGLNLEEVVDARDRTNFGTALAFLLSYTPLRDFAGRSLERKNGTLKPGTQAEIDSLRVQAIIWINCGRWVAAAASAERAVACARANRDDLSLMHCLLQLQLATAGLDDYRKVLEIGCEIERLGARTQNPRYHTFGLLGQGLALTFIGDLTQGEAMLDRAMASLEHEVGPLPEAMGAGFSALCALRKGQQERAEHFARASMAAIRRARWAMVELRNALLCVLEVYLADTCADRPTAEIEHALGMLHRMARQFPFAESTAWLFQGRYEWLNGRPRRAAAALRRSMRASERLGSRYDHMLARYWLGRLAQSPAGRRNVPEGSVRHLRVALALSEHLGLPWEARHARAALELKATSTRAP